MDLELLERRSGIALSALFSSPKQRADLSWAQRVVVDLPPDMAANLLKEYCRRHGRNERSANIWLRCRAKAVAAMVRRWPIPLEHLSTELRRAAIAREWADRCRAALDNATQFGTEPMDAKALLHRVKAPADQWGFCPVLPSFERYEQRKANGEFERHGAMYDAICAAIARLVDEAWWVRQLERAWRRWQEHGAIIMGKVRTGVSPYVSHQSIRDYQNRKQAAAAWLSGNYVVNEQQNLELILADAVAASVANPENRRAELMVRMRGFEDYAEEHGFVGEFYTWTAPSKFHSWKKSKKGPCYANARYHGASPRDTQRYLCSQWAKARAAIAREGVEVFGFRVVEPHHDGTPHWHLLLFVKPGQLRLLRSLMRRYALEHDKAELAPPKGKKAPRHSGYRARFDFKTIDPRQGSATGYIAKYIAKNIDGAYVDADWEAETSGKHGAQGVAAWASLWGIRQFQQIGGPGVTVWRELRRLTDIIDWDDVMEAARNCADLSNWRGFLHAMGGVNLPRAERPVQLYKTVSEAASQYGEDVQRIKGVIGLESHTPLETRLEGWEISRQSLEERRAAALGSGASRAAVASTSGDSRAPWSSDNNCTQGSKRAETIGAGTQILLREMQKLGLDPCHLHRLRAGAVFELDGTQVCLRDGLLLVSKSSRIEDPRHGHAERIEADTVNLERAEAKAITAELRRDAWSLLRRGGDVEHWLSQLPAAQHDIALAQLAEVIEREQFDRRISQEHHHLPSRTNEKPSPLQPLERERIRQTLKQRANALRSNDHEPV